jgi:iron complex transport system permease protein
MFIKQRPLLVNSAALAAFFLLSTAVGAVFIAPETLFRILAHELPGINLTVDWPDTYAAILLQVRLPHALLVAITGAALSGSGAAFQGLFRNPLADPYLIGVASGAGLGAVFALSVEWPNTLLGLYAVPISAFVGGIVTVGLVMSLARTEKMLSSVTLILAGVAVSAFASALTSYLMLRSDDELRRAISWLLGGAVMAGWEPVLSVLPFVTAGLVGLLFSGHALNVLQLGDEQARQLGFPVDRARLIIIALASLTTAAAVSFSGIIGFVGLIVPHVGRMIWGSDYRGLLPISIIGGAAVLLAADLVARVALAPQTLPVGIVTALGGAPFFLWILRRARTEVFWQ